MTILKPIRVLLSTSLHRLYASYTTALLCLPGLPFFRLPHWYGTRHNVDREQGTVNGSTRVSLLLVCEPGTARPRDAVGREEQGHEDDKRIVLRHGGGRHRRVFGRLTSPAECPTKPRRRRPHRRQRPRRRGHQRPGARSWCLGNR